MDYPIEMYQWSAKGIVKGVLAMTKEELQIALCETMDIIDNIEVVNEKVHHIITKWRD